MAKLTNEYIFYGKKKYEKIKMAKVKNLKKTIALIKVIALKKVIALIIMVKFSKAKPTILKLILIKLVMVRFDSN